MSRLFYHVMQDNAGNLLFDVTGTMRLAGTSTPATIYGDEALTVILPNPMTNHVSYASFKCFLGAGDYDFYMAKPGYSFETLTGVQGHGTLAQQDASAVNITGGSATLSGLDVSGLMRAMDRTVLGAVQTGYLNASASVFFDKTARHGLIFKQLASDVGASQPILFRSTTDTDVGFISTTASATAYNTTSDARLKEDVQPLDGALDVLRALNPITHRWRSDHSPGVGFLAHEVAEVVGGVVTGERDAVDEKGQIVPQMMDYSKLVPYLVGAIKALTEQVEVLTARLETAVT